jgi:DNA (cytosine-5)-methyltransferase 1
MYRPTLKGYFSGSGIFEYALAESGCDPVQSLELNQICCDTMRLNLKHKIVQADIGQVTVLDQPKTDVHVHTYPCTKYSAIADIHGTRTGDELFLHAFRHTALEQPEAFVLENVPGMRKFKVVMEAFTKIPNYYVQVFCPIDAINWLPQKRQRLIIIATRKPFNIQAPTQTKAITLKDIVERNAKIQIPDYAFKRLRGEYRDMPIISDPDRGDIAPTCVAHYAKDVSTRMVKDGKRIRPYTVREYARLQGFPDSYQFAGTDRDAYRQIGNAVARPVGQWVGKQLIKYFN